MRMFSHTCQMPNDLASTGFTEQQLCKIAVAKTGPTCGQSLRESIVVALPLIDAMMGQTVCPFTLIVGGNHGMWRRNTDTASVGDTTQKVKNVSLGSRFWWLEKFTREALETLCLSAKALSGHCSHTDITCAVEGLETDSVVDGVTNFGTSKWPWMDGACICHCMGFKFD